MSGNSYCRGVEGTVGGNESDDGQIIDSKFRQELCDRMGMKINRNEIILILTDPDEIKHLFKRRK